MKKKQPTVKIALTAGHLATLREALDSWLYESAPENYRNSGNVLDPRHQRAPLTLEDRGVVSLLQEHGEIEAVLRDGEEALTERGKEADASTIAATIEEAKST